MRPQKDASKNCHVGVKYLGNPTFVDPGDSGGSSGRNIIPNEMTNNRVIFDPHRIFCRPLSTKCGSYLHHDKNINSKHRWIYY